jgi:hypothetical protein
MTYAPHRTIEDIVIEFTETPDFNLHFMEPDIMDIYANIALAGLETLEQDIIIDLELAENPELSELSYVQD